MTKEVLPRLLDKNEADIITISSAAGLYGNTKVAEYSASKFAAIGMSESLMKEVHKNNIRVNTSTPCTIESDMTIDLGFVIKHSHESGLYPDDFAELIVAT